MPSSAVEQAVESIVARRYVLSRSASCWSWRCAAGWDHHRAAAGPERRRHQPRRALALDPAADFHRWRGLDRIQRGWAGYLHADRFHGVFAGRRRAHPHSGQRSLCRHARFARTCSRIARSFSAINRPLPSRPVPGQGEIYVTVDGQQSIQLAEGDTVHIRKAPQCVSLAMLPGVSFFEVLRQKLKWGGAAI